MKKFVSLLLAFVLCISLAACGENSPKEAEVTVDPTEEAEITVDPTEEARATLLEAYNTFCKDLDSSYAHLDLFNDYLVIKSTPQKGKYNEAAMKAIVAVTSFLPLSNSLGEKISITSSLRAMHSQDCGDYTVSWVWDDDGLSIIYEVNS